MTRRRSNFIFVYLLVTIYLLARVVKILDLDGLIPAINPAILFGVRIILSIFSFVQLILPWFLKFDRFKRNSISDLMGINNAEELAYIYGLLSLISIGINGFIFLVLGGSIPQFYLFLSGSLFSIVIWRIFKDPFKRKIRLPEDES